jgi:predicted ferric reductase
LGVVIIAAALTHVFLVDYYVSEPWERVLWVAMTGAFVLLVAWVRVVRPVQRYRNPWRIEKVVPERGQCYTLVLEPSRRHDRNHGGFAFQAGQFAWIMVGGSVRGHPAPVLDLLESRHERPGGLHRQGRRGLHLGHR